MKKGNLIIFIALFIALAFAVIIAIISGISAFGSGFNSAVSLMLVAYQNGLIENAANSSEALIAAAESAKGWFTVIFVISAIVAIALGLCIAFALKKKKDE